MRLQHVDLVAYGRSKDVGIDIGENLTVVVGTNEAGKSTALDALTDLLWGIPPRSTRDHDVARPQLRIDAAVDVDGETRRLMRKSTGLFADDLLTTVSAPWDPSNTLNRSWWRTRLGINHTDLRDAGKATFDGTGDIADIIFAAREGRSAREILNTITERIESSSRRTEGTGAYCYGLPRRATKMLWRTVLIGSPSLAMSSNNARRWRRCRANATRPGKP